MSLKKILDKSTRSKPSLFAKIFVFIESCFRVIAAIYRQFRPTTPGTGRDSSAAISRPLQKRKSKATPTDAVDKNFVWPNPGNYDFSVVGTSFHQGELKQIVGDHGAHSPNHKCIARLIPYKFNTDSMAVKVTINDIEIGHLGAGEARSFRKRLSAKGLGSASTSCQALIDGGFMKKNGERATYWVKLDIKSFA